MNTNTVNQAVRQFITGHFFYASRRALQDDDPLLESGIIDSLGVLDLVTFIETRFGVTVTDDEMVSENFSSIGGITHYIEAKKRDVA